MNRSSLMWFLFLLPVDFSCEGLGQLLVASAWRAERFFVLFAVEDDWPACFMAEGAICEVAGETPTLRLWRCVLDVREPAVL